MQLPTPGLLWRAVSASPRHRPKWPGALCIALAALLAAPLPAAATQQAPTDVTLKAAFLFNFAKFAEWAALEPGAPIVVCVVGDEQVATAFVGIIRGQNINGHRIQLTRPPSSATWRTCHLLFVANADLRLSSAGLDGVSALPVLTVSDGKGFSRTGGIIEFYLEGDRMRFAINVDAAKRSGIRLSSRLLGLAKVIRDDNVR